MQFTVLNPYSSVGVLHQKGLDALSVSLFAVPGIDVDKLTKYIVDYMMAIPAFADYDIGELELSAVIPEAMNAYALGVDVAGAYSGEQRILIAEMMQVSDGPTLSSIPDYLTNLQNSVARSKMTKAQQKPLFAALSVGIKNYDYWVTQLDEPTSPWIDFLETLEGLRMDIPSYVQAAIFGSLTAYGKLGRANVLDSEMIATLAGSLGVGVGKVLFKWIPEQRSTNYGQSALPTAFVGQLPTPPMMPEGFQFPQMPDSGCGCH